MVGAGPNFLRFGSPVERDLCDWVVGHRRWGRGGETTGRSSKGSVTAGAGRDHRSGPSAGAAGRRDRLGVSRSALRRHLHAGSGPTWLADPAGGGAVHPEAHAQSVGRSAVCALAGEPLLPILLRRAELPPSAAV